MVRHVVERTAIIKGTPERSRIVVIANLGPATEVDCAVVANEEALERTRLAQIAIAKEAASASGNSGSAANVITTDVIAATGWFITAIGGAPTDVATAAACVARWLTGTSRFAATRWFTATIGLAGTVGLATACRFAATVGDAGAAWLFTATTGIAGAIGLAAAARLLTATAWFTAGAAVLAIAAERYCVNLGVHYYF